MFSKKWLGAAVLGIAAACLLLTPQTSEAQWRGGRGGFSIGVGRGGVWTGPGYGGYGYPGYYNNYGYYGSRYNNPYYGSRYYGSRYSPYYYGSRYANPYYSGYYSQPSYIYTAPETYASYAPETVYQAPVADPNTAGFVVHVPDYNAEVWFDDHKTQQAGTVREFTTGRLNPGNTYTFHIRARWTENGRQVEQVREATARAGQQATVDFRNQANTQVPIDY